MLAVRQLLDKAGLAGADLIGASVGGAFAAEIAAIFPGHVKKLALLAPFGLFDEADPATDPWAQRRDAVAGLMCADAEKWSALVSPPEGANSVEWPIEMVRASEAAARAFWPLGATKLEKRLGLIAAPTLLLWGEKDAVIPRELCAEIRAPGSTAARGSRPFRMRAISPISTGPRRWPGRSGASRLGCAWLLRLRAQSLLSRPLSPKREVRR